MEEPRDWNQVGVIKASVITTYKAGELRGQARSGVTGLHCQVQSAKWKATEPAQQLLWRVKGSQVGRLGMGQLQFKRSPVCRQMSSGEVGRLGMGQWQFKRSPMCGQLSSGEALDTGEKEMEANY